MSLALEVKVSAADVTERISVELRSVTIAAAPAEAAWGRNRTGTGFPPRDFRTTAAFAAAWQRHAFVVWTLPLPSRARSSRARIRQGPSSLYTFLGGAHVTTQVLARATEGRRTRLLLLTTGAQSAQCRPFWRQLRRSTSIAQTPRYRYVPLYGSSLEPRSTTGS